jgi:hypothetical protein
MYRIDYRYIKIVQNGTQALHENTEQVFSSAGIHIHKQTRYVNSLGLLN